MQNIPISRSSTRLVLGFTAFASFCFFALAVFELVTGTVFSNTLDGLKFSMLLMLSMWNGKMTIEIYRVYTRPNSLLEL